MTDTIETTNSTATAETNAPEAPKKAPRTAGTAKKVQPKAKPAGITYAQYVQAIGGRSYLGIGGGPKGSAVHVDGKPAGQIVVRPIVPEAGPDATLEQISVAIPTVGTVTLPFMGAETHRYVAGLFRKYAVDVRGGNIADSTRTATGLLPKLAGGEHTIWRRPGMGANNGGTLTLTAADLASLVTEEKPKRKAGK